VKLDHREMRMLYGLFPLLLGAFAAILGRGASGGSTGTDGPAQPSVVEPTSAAPAARDFALPPGPAPDPDLTGETPRGDSISDWQDGRVVERPQARADDSWSGPTAEEQLLVELINRARMDPLAEVDRLDEALAGGISSAPVQPLAVTTGLSNAAREHSQDMDDRDFFAHTNPSGQSAADRAIEEGHGSRFVGENIGWIGSSREPSDIQARVASHHEDLWESDGHQRNMMSDDWSEIGAGYDYADHNGFTGSTFVTTKFGDLGKTYLTGVVIADADRDAFYDMGEGLGGVRVTADDGRDTFWTETWESGGYSLALPAGTYRVSFGGGDLDAPVETVVTILDKNVKLDVVEDRAVAIALAAEPPARDGQVSDVLDFLPLIPIEDLPPEDADFDEEEDLLLV
jgi:uncharacterized protein YkwD